METFRRSFVHFEYSKAKRRKKRLRRRNTIGDTREAQSAVSEARAKHAPFASSSHFRFPRPGSSTSREGFSLTDPSLRTSGTLDTTSSTARTSEQDSHHRFLGLEVHLPSLPRHAQVHPCINEKCILSINGFVDGENANFSTFVECLESSEQVAASGSLYKPLSSSKIEERSKGGQRTSSCVPASANASVKLREGIQYDEGAHSSSGNWSGSSSTRTSLESDNIKSQCLHPTQRTNQGSPALSSEQESTISESPQVVSSSPSLSNQRTNSRTTDDLPSTSSHTSDGTLTPTQDIQDIPFLEDDTSSAYSCDTEGYYTSFHIDSGLHPSVGYDNTIQFMSGSERELYTRGSSGTTNSSIASLGTVVMRNPEKKTPPKPPQRVSSLEKKRESVITVIHVNGSNSSREDLGSSHDGDIEDKPSTRNTDSHSSKGADSGRETSSSPLEVSSPRQHGSGHGGQNTEKKVDIADSRQQFKQKVEINSSQIPSMCAVTPPVSDDESLRASAALHKLNKSEGTVSKDTYLTSHCGRESNARNSFTSQSNVQSHKLNTKSSTKPKSDVNSPHTYATVQSYVSSEKAPVFVTESPSDILRTCSTKGLLSESNSSSVPDGNYKDVQTSQIFSGVPLSVKKGLVIAPTGSLERKKAHSKSGARVTLDSDGKVLYSSDSLPRTKVHSSYEPGTHSKQGSTSILQSSCSVPPMQESALHRVRQLSLPSSETDSKTVREVSPLTKGVMKSTAEDSKGSAAPCTQKPLESISGSLNNSIYGASQKQQAKDGSQSRSYQTSATSESLCSSHEPKTNSTTVMQGLLPKTTIQQLQEQLLKKTQQQYGSTLTSRTATETVQHKKEKKDSSEVPSVEASHSPKINEAKGHASSQTSKQSDIDKKLAQEAQQQQRQLLYLQQQQQAIQLQMQLEQQQMQLQQQVQQNLAQQQQKLQMLQQKVPQTTEQVYQTRESLLKQRLQPSYSGQEEDRPLQIQLHHVYPKLCDSYQASLPGQKDLYQSSLQVTQQPTKQGASGVILPSQLASLSPRSQRTGAYVSVHSQSSLSSTSLATLSGTASLYTSRAQVSSGAHVPTSRAPTPVQGMMTSSPRRMTTLFMQPQLITDPGTPFSLSCRSVEPNKDNVFMSLAHSQLLQGTPSSDNTHNTHSFSQSESFLSDGFSKTKSSAYSSQGGELASGVANSSYMSSFQRSNSYKLAVTPTLPDSSKSVVHSVYTSSESQIEDIPVVNRTLLHGPRLFRTSPVSVRNINNSTALQERNSLGSADRCVVNPNKGKKKFYGAQVLINPELLKSVSKRKENASFQYENSGKFRRPRVIAATKKDSDKCLDTEIW